MNREMSDEQERDAAVAEIRKQVLARPGASKIPAEIDALKFGDSPLTPEQRKILADMPQALTPMNMHQKMAEANAEIDRLTAERDAARAEVERLRAACEGVPEMLATAANQIHPHTFQRYVGKYRAAADAIHAVLENEAADGEGVRG